MACLETDRLKDEKSISLIKVNQKAEHRKSSLMGSLYACRQTVLGRKKFSFVADQTNLNHTAISVIIRTLSSLQRERKCVDVLYVARPKEKKEFKTLQKLLGLGKGKGNKSPQNDTTKLNFTAVMLNEPREVQRFIDPANLPRQQGGYHPYQHEDFVQFFQRLDNLRRVCAQTLQNFDSVRRESVKLHKLSRRSVTGLKRSTKVIEAHSQKLRDELDLEKLSKECESFLADLMNPERDFVYAQTPRILLSAPAIQEVEGGD
ncbi:uncharacterized protein LOC134844865 [Symsagittifera roscoffensis]|uniref:uncharacterized protein LOC134844865 n=1 Tax=Symsagittifera roscoffensis TaxID=84072 RepID=UPI00307BE3B5